MPFQAIKIAMRHNTGSPLAKLAWVWIVDQASLDDAPNGMAFAEFQLEDIAQFCQCTKEEAKVALALLERLQFISCLTYGGFEELSKDPEQVWVDVNLPVSQLVRDERKRIKVSPDQLFLLHAACNYRCAACGLKSFEPDDFEVDHIIPQSIGGADVEENCQFLCKPCNSRKRASVHWVDFLMGRK